MVQLNFKPSEIQTESRGIIEPQWVVATIVESNVSPTKKAGGHKLELTFQIDGERHPEIGNRRIWENLNIVNANATAVEIAERDLAAICNACSIGELTDTEQLHGIPLAIKLSIEPAKNGYDEKNKIAEYDAETARFKPGASRQGAPAASAGTAEAEDSAKPDWMK